MTMKKCFIYRNTFIAVFLVASLFCAAQNKTSVKASVDKNKIVLGERFNLTLRVIQNAKDKPFFFSVDNIPHFEIVSKDKIDTSTTDKTVSLQQTIQLTSFDSGHWYIPAFHWDKKTRTDSLPVDVIFSDFDPRQPYHDIKEIMEVSPKQNKAGWKYAVIAGVVLLALLVFFLTRKKKQVVNAGVKPIDPFAEALSQLGNLQKENISFQQFYTELTNVFRLYIFRRKGIHSLQKTTDDLILQLRDLNMNKDQFEKLAEALRLSDAVKFAKYIPAHTDNVQVFDTIKNAIQSIEQLK